MSDSLEITKDTFNEYLNDNHHKALVINIQINNLENKEEKIDISSNKFAIAINENVVSTTEEIKECKQIDVDAHIIPQHKVLSQNMDHRIVWYFTNDVISSNSYYVCTMYGDPTRQEFKFKKFLTSKDPKLEIYYVVLKKPNYIHNAKK
eukprot:137793_1